MTPADILAGGTPGTHNGRCTACGHDGVSHNTGRCTVTATYGIAGDVDYGPGGCGCTALAPDRTCPTCGARYYCGIAGHETHDCRACYDRKRADTDRASFAPLVDALRRHGVPIEYDDPWNTGGGVMCLALPLPLPVGAPADADAPYWLFSDHAEMLGAGLYFGDGDWLNYSPEWAATAESDADRLYEWAPWAERVAAWFAPVYATVAAWAADGIALTTSDGRYARETAATMTAPPPAIAGTLPVSGEVGGMVYPRADMGD